MAFADAEVDVTADFSNFDREFAAKLRRAATAAGKAAEPAMRRAGRDAGDAFWDEAAGRWRSSATGRFTVAGDRLGRAFQNAAERHTKNIAVDVDRSTLSRLTAVFGSLAKTGGLLAGFTALASTMLAAVGAATSLAAALAPAANALLALPAAGLGAAAAISAVTVAMQGMGDALSAGLSGDTAGFNEALQKLTPNAQAAAKAIIAFRPALDGIRRSVQQALFAGLSSDLSALGRTWLPLARTQLTAFAATLNRAFDGFAKAASAPQTIRDISTALDGARAGLAQMLTAVPGLTSAFAGLAATAGPFLSQIGAAIGRAGTALAGWLTQSRASGQLAAMFQTAYQVISQLGTILTNVGSILGHVFSAAEGAGGGLLGNLVQITTALRQILSSAQGMQVLSAFFTTASQLVTVLLSVVGKLVGTLGSSLVPLFGVLGKTITALAPALNSIAKLAGQLGAALVTALGGLLTNIGPALSSLLSGLASAIGPLLQPVGQLIAALGGPLAAALRAVAALVTPVVKALSAGLAAALPSVTKAISAIGTAMGPLADVFGTVGDAVGQLLKPILSLVKPLADIVAAFAPLISMSAKLATALLGALLPPLVKVVTLLAGSLKTALTNVTKAWVQVIPAVTKLIPPVIKVINAFAPLSGIFGVFAAQILAKLLPALLKVGPTLMKALVPAIVAGAKALAQFADAVKPLAPVLSKSLVQAFNALKPVLPPIVKAIGDLTKAFVPLIPAFLKVAVPIATLVTKLVALGIIHALIPTIQLLTRVFTSTIPALVQVVTWVTSGVRSFSQMIAAGAALIGWFTQLPSRILGALASLGQGLLRSFTGAWNSATAAARRGGNAIVSFVTGIPGRIAAALGSLPARLGASMTTSFNTGRSRTVSGVGRIVSAAAALPGRVISAIGSLGGRLSAAISSAFNRGAAAARSGVGRIVSYVSSLPGRIGNAASGVAGAIVGQVRSAINSAISYINGKIRAIPGVGSHLPTIPYLARGAVITSPTVAMVGEAGPEVVIPLSPSRRARAQQLARESGLTTTLAAGNTSQLGLGNTFNATFNIESQAQDPETVAYKVSADVARWVERVA